MIDRSRWFTACLSGFLLLAGATAAQTGAPVKIAATVTEVSGTTVTLAIVSDLLPCVGDPVSLSQEIPGVGPAAVRGEWEVIDVGEDFAVASANGEAAKPQPGQQAEITSAAPRGRQQVRVDAELLSAADTGSAAGVHAAIGTGAEVNVRGQGGSTPLMRAATEGHTDVMRMLLDQGADASLEARGGQTALGVAAAQGHAEAISLLLDSGADIDTRVTSVHASEDMRGATPLMLAARFGHPEAAQRLLQAGADPGASSPRGDTALLMAVQHGSGETVQAFLAAGADPNAGRADGVSPLIIAAGEGDPVIVHMLTSAGADLHQELPDSVPAPFAGMTPLLVAAHSGRAEAVVALLAAGADAAATNVEGQNAIALATAAGHDGVIAALRDPATAIAASLDEMNEALVGACEDGDSASVRQLLGAGADPNARSLEEGATPLMMAASASALDAIELLLQMGADINTQARGDEDGEGAGFTALMIAALYGNQEAATALLQAGADPRITTPDGQTAAALARAEGHESLARMLESGD